MQLTSMQLEAHEQRHVRDKLSTGDVTKVMFMWSKLH